MSTTEHYRAEIRKVHIAWLESNNGSVEANAGIDQSNVGSPEAEETALLWTVDPDASAAKLRGEIWERAEIDVAVVVNDSLGRACRNGTVGTAIGLAGVVDLRGGSDLFGRLLRSTVAQAVPSSFCAARRRSAETPARANWCATRRPIFSDSSPSLTGRIQFESAGRLPAICAWGRVRYISPDTEGRALDGGGMDGGEAVA